MRTVKLNMAICFFMTIGSSYSYGQNIPKVYFKPTSLRVLTPTSQINPFQIVCTGQVTGEKKEIVPRSEKPVSHPGGGTCYIFKNKYSNTFETMTVPPNRRDKIFLGAIYEAPKIIDNSFIQYNVQRNLYPMNINIDLVDLSRKSVSDSMEITTYDFNSVENKKLQLLNRNINGKAPFIMNGKIVELESTNQVRASTNTSSQVNVDAAFKFPIEQITTDFQTAVSVYNTATSNVLITEHNNDLLVVIEQVFYTAYLTPKSRAAGTSGYNPFFADTRPEDKNLVYVSSVNYGRRMMVKISSKLKKSDLSEYLKREIGSTTNVKVQEPVLGINAAVNVGVKTSDESELNKKLVESVNQIEFQYEGGPAPSQLPTTLAILKKYLSSSLSLKATDIPTYIPISYNLRVADGTHATAYCNVSFEYLSNNCGQVFKLDPVKYDISLELSKFEVLKVDDNDATEDLYGSMDFTYIKSGAKTQGIDLNYWNKAQADAYVNNYPTGIFSLPGQNKKLLLSNLTYDEIIKSIIYIGGRLYDRQEVIGDRKYRNYSANEVDGGDYYKTIVNFENYRSDNIEQQISKIQLGSEIDLTLSGDKFITIEYFEDGKDKASASKVKYYWKIWVKAHN